jgi:hypothetical protein
VAFLSSTTTLAQSSCTLTLTDGPDRDIVALLQNQTCLILDSINRFDKSRNRLILPNTLTNGDGSYGAQRLTELVKASGMRVASNQLTSQVITLNDNTFEIRRLYVNTSQTNTNRTQELVLTFDKVGRLLDARFALPEHQFDMILNESISLEDDFRRRQIINFLEQFKTAYNRKDVNYIELQFSDKALIITGTRVQESTQRGNNLKINSSERYQDQYQLIRQSKIEYISNLKNKIFKNNAYVNVDFSGINILQHPDYEDIYWVQVFQKWSSSTYSDMGYLSFMIDFSDENQPLIYVRAWQPEPFSDGTLIDLNMFEIIR